MGEPSMSWRSVGVFDQITSVFRGNARRHAEQDVGDLMDVSLDRSESVIKRLSVAMADLTAGRMRLQIQLDELAVTMQRLDEDARSAVEGGRDDQARVALTRRSQLGQQVEAITEQRDGLRAEQEKLALVEQRLRARIEAFRARRTTIEAQHTAAEARVMVGEAVAGLSEDMADVSLAASRAQGRIESMEARADALDELIRSGGLGDLAGEQALVQAGAPDGDPALVDAELARLKHEVDSGSQPAEGAR